jgi:hypothetical protein
MLRGRHLAGLAIVHVSDRISPVVSARSSHRKEGLLVNPICAKRALLSPAHLYVRTPVRRAA